MTVKELIERLETLDPAMQIRLEFWRDEGDTGSGDIKGIYIYDGANGEQIAHLSTEEQ